VFELDGQAVENVAEENAILVRYMIASWEFLQFVQICRDFLLELESGDRKDNDSKSDEEEKDASTYEEEDEKE
jgi:hypothetical protein